MSQKETNDTAMEILITPDEGNVEDDGCSMSSNRYDCEPSKLQTAIALTCLDAHRCSEENRSDKEDVAPSQQNRNIHKTTNAPKDHALPWLKMYQQLVLYKQKHNTTCVPLFYKEVPKLAAWVRYQRRRCKNKHRVDLLNTIGFEWRPLDSQWMEMYQRLVRYKKEHKSTCVPLGFERDPKLGRWVAYQRKFCNNKNRVDLLNSIGFEWSRVQPDGQRKANKKVIKQWETMYQHLVTYKQKYNTTCVPERKDPKLAAWVRLQRQHCKKKDRIDLLNSIGFEWKPLDSQWTGMYQQLIQHKNKYNTTWIPERSKEYPKLGMWVQTQRSKCKRKDRVDLLNAIGFEWSRKATNTDNSQDTEDIGFELTGIDSEWMEMYQRLVQYKQRYNNTCVPRQFQEDPKLGAWVVIQRERCGRKDRVNLLNSIGFEWLPIEAEPMETSNDFDDSDEIQSHTSEGSVSLEQDKMGEIGANEHAWNAMYQRFVQYKQKYNTTCVPYLFEEDPKLAFWVRHQRQRCKRKDRVDLLNSVGFEWKGNMRHSRWMKMYFQLVQYKMKYNTTSVPRNFKADPELGIWVSRQRSHCKQKERVDLLNNIGFVWAKSHQWKR